MALKSRKTFDDTLSALYDAYVLADDSTLDESAKTLKRHYAYVIKDLVEHDELYFIDDEDNIPTTTDEAKYELKKFLMDFFKKNEVYKVSLKECEGGRRMYLEPMSEIECDKIINYIYEGDEDNG